MTPTDTNDRTTSDAALVGSRHDRGHRPRGGGVNFARIVQLLVSRWYVAVGVFLVLVAAFVAAYALYPSQYAARAVLVLTLPDNSGRISVDPRVRNDVTNPLLNFDDGLSTSAAILIASANSPASGARVSGSIPAGATYAVSNGSSNPEITSKGPFVYIETTARSAADAQRTAAVVDQLVRDDLQARQVELRAPPPTFLSLLDVVAPTPAEEQTASRTRAGGAALVLCILLTIAITDRVDARRRRKAVDVPGPVRQGGSTPVPSQKPPRAAKPTPTHRATSSPDRPTPSGRPAPGSPAPRSPATADADGAPGPRLRSFDEDDPPTDTVTVTGARHAPPADHGATARRQGPPSSAPGSAPNGAGPAPNGPTPNGPAPNGRATNAANGFPNREASGAINGRVRSDGPDRGTSERPR